MSKAQKSKKGFGQITTTSDEGSRRKNTSTEPNLRFASQPSIGNKKKGKNSKIKEQLFRALSSINKEINMTIDSKEKIEKICYFVTEFWHIHPFREGNTRTSAMLLYFLIKKANLHVNIDFLSKNGKYFRNALALNSLYSNSKPEYILGIVTDSVTLKNISSKKYETIEGFEVNKYSYSNHTIEKIKTIEKPFDWHK